MYTHFFLTPLNGNWVSINYFSYNKPKWQNIIKYLCQNVDNLVIKLKKEHLNTKLP